MKKPQEFPYEHQAGGLVFRIYSAPQTINLKNGSKVTHDSFLVTRYEGGRRVPTRKKTWEEVEAHVEDVVSAHRKNDPESLELSGRDRRIYLAAVEALSPLGVDVDAAARDYATARNLLATRGLQLVQGARM